MDRVESAAAGGEIGDDEVIHAHGEGQQRPADDAGHQLGQHHLPESPPGVAPRSMAAS